jgi:chromosome partitioning protein
MKVLTVATLKGGNAKTTTCLAVAAALAEKGHSVALVDADPQSTATMIFGLKPVAEPWAAEPIELYLKELQAGSITLVRGGRPLRLASPKQRDSFLRREEVRADVMIIDTAPGEIELVDAALRQAHVLLIPVEPSPLSLTGMSDVAALARRIDPPPRIRTVLTRAHKIRVSTRDLAERVNRLLPGTLCRTRIPEDARVVDSPDFGLPVTLSERRCRASGAYRELVEELHPILFGRAKSAAHAEGLAATATRAAAHGH